MQTSSWRLVGAAAAVVTIGCSAFAIGAAVSSDNGGSAPPAPTSTAVAIPVSTVAGSAAPGTSTPAAAAQAVTIVNFAFDPPELTVPVGATVTWTNDDDVTHNVLSPDVVIASPDLAGGDSYEVTLDQEGTIDYQCDIHQYMRGTITVTP